MSPRLGWDATQTPPMPYRLLKLAESGGLAGRDMWTAMATTHYVLHLYT